MGVAFILDGIDDVSVPDLKYFLSRLPRIASVRRISAGHQRLCRDDTYGHEQGRRGLSMRSSQLSVFADLCPVIRRY